MPPRRWFAKLAWVAKLALAVAGGVTLSVACHSSLGLAPATAVNVVDTVTLYALDGTPLTTPSAYAISGRTPVLTTLSPAFDFAFNLDSLSPDSLNEPVLLPPGALRLGRTAGLQRVASTFSEITLAPTGGYVIDKPVVVDTGTVLLARSGTLTCSTGTMASLYAKLHILTIDTLARRIRFEILTDQNCGYRGLAPGLPAQ